MSIIQRREGDSPFDMRMAFYEELHKLRMKKDEFALLGDISGWLTALEQIHIKTEFMFTREFKGKKSEDIAKESEILHKEFTKLNYALSHIYNMEKSKRNIIIRNIRRKLIELDYRINRLLDKRGIIIPHREIKDGFKGYSNQL